MSIARILVPLTGEQRDRTALKTAIAIARPFNAHVAALFVHLDPKYAYPYASIPLSPVTIEDVLADAEDVAMQAEKRARSVVSVIALEEDVPVVNPPVKSDRPTCSFKTVMGLFHDSVLKEAELCDLIVFGPVDTNDEPEVSEAFLDALLRIEQPVLIAPEPPARMARKLAIGWDGSTVAAHAVRTAMPFLRGADSVEILTVSLGKDSSQVIRLKEYLALHGVSAIHRDIEKPAGKTIGETLLDAAVLNGDDLLVIGGYGHGYWRETLFGGVTSHIRWHARLPVLMVH